ncbi:11000_t:CDS:1, partial [Acaulospora colombiana]
DPFPHNTCKTMTETDFEAINKNFTEWFCANGGIISSKIAFKDYTFENAGRGVVAIDDIEVYIECFHVSS